MVNDGRYLNSSNPAPDAAWQVWYQDVFDRECPRQVEVEGRGLAAGLAELWARHLFETVGVDGQEGFSRFDLWWKQAGKSIKVVGSWAGLVRLRAWIFGDKRQTTIGYIGDGNQDLLMRVARVHGQLILAGQTSEGILEASAHCESREEFESQLQSLEQDAMMEDD
jgi:hypothetical protein